MNRPVLVATTSDIYADYITKYVKKENAFIKVLWAQDRKTFEKFVKTEKPELIILETNFFSAATSYCIYNMVEKKRRIRIAVAAFEDISDESRERFYAVGAIGFINFRHDRQQFTDGMRALVRHEEENFEPFIKGKTEAKFIFFEHPTITKREMEVMLISVQGKKCKEVGEILGISEKSVRNYKNSFYGKTGVTNSMELLLFFTKTGWVDIEDNHAVLTRGDKVDDIAV